MLRSGLSGYAGRVYELEQDVVGRMWNRADRQCMNESRMWWEECGAGLDMQTGYEGEQGVVERV